MIPTFDEARQRAACAAGVTILLFAMAGAATAQAPAPPSPSPTPAAEAAPAAGPRYDEVVITGEPPARTISDLAPPATVLEGEKLTMQQAPQLGEVLANEPGVTQTYFGPGASRPVIRG